MNAPAALNSSTATMAEIERRLRHGLALAHLEVEDEGAAHVGHAGAAGGGHFRLRIVSMSFHDLKLVQRHRLVNQLLAPLFTSGIHALAMETFTPEEFALKNQCN